MKKLKIGICGWGNVATGLYKVIKDSKLEIQEKSNLDIEIVVIGARRDNPKCNPSDVLIERDIFDVLDHDIDVMVELIGGVEVARKLLLSAIDKGVNIVTANKAVLYHHGDEIFLKAKEKNIQVLYESSVCAGTPIIKMLTEELAANKITKISGMLNGTSNFILSEMEFGADFDETLVFAQKEGYAEPDPTFDIEGLDAGHKIGLLSSIAFGTNLPPEDFHIEGIKDLEKIDFEYAKMMGYTIKHLAVASMDDKQIQLRAHPALIPNESFLANMKNVRNGIEIQTDLIGSVHIAGSGAGQESTASGLVSDLVYLSRLNNNNKISQHEDLNNKIKIQNFSEMKFKYFYHIKLSEPDIDLEVVKNIFIKNQISISSSKIFENETGNSSMIVITDYFKNENKQVFESMLKNIDSVSNFKSIIIES